MATRTATQGTNICKNILYQNNLPEGVIVVQYKGGKYCQPISGSRDILDLRYNVINKLKIADCITSKMKTDIKNLFSDKDILLIKKVIDNFSNKIKNFLKIIIADNLICYSNDCHKHIIQLLNSLNSIEKYNTKENHYFSKYMSLSNLANEKISTFENGKIYMSTPREFNDRFDCQLHLHSCEHSFGKINLNTRHKIIDTLTIIGVGIHIYSFSLNDPEAVESNHMWGLYADNGKGIALKYKLTDLTKIILRNHFNTDPYQNMMITNVIYDEMYNPFTKFQQLIKNDNYDYNSMIDFLNTMVSHKSRQWEHEREVRLYKYSFDKLLPYFENKKKVASGKLSQTELEKISYDGVDNQPIFFKPCKIILGWNCSEDDGNIQRLLTYAKNNGIEVIKLDKCIDYKNNNFFILNR